MAGIAFSDILSPDRLCPIWVSLTHPCRCAVSHLGLSVSVVLQLFVVQMVVSVGRF